MKKGHVGDSKLVDHKKVLAVKSNSFKFGGFNLPTTMDLTKWSGNVQFNEDYTSAVVYLNKDSMEYHVQLFDNYQIVKIVEDKETLIEFKDTMDNTYDLSNLTRTIKAHKYFFYQWRISG